MPEKFEQNVKAAFTEVNSELLKQSEIREIFDTLFAQAVLNEQTKRADDSDNINNLWDRFETRPEFKIVVDQVKDVNDSTKPESIRTCLRLLDMIETFPAEVAEYAAAEAKKGEIDTATDVA